VSKMPHVTLEIDSVYCRETEDTGWLGSADEFYLSGIIQGGRVSSTVITEPIRIDNGETKNIPKPLVFSGPVPHGAPLRIALQAFDNDAAKDWADRAAGIDILQKKVDEKWKEHRPNGTVTGPPDPSNDEARNALKWIVDGLQFLATTDVDDLLGTLTVDIPISNDRLLTESRYSWHLTGDDADYVVKYRLTAIQDGATPDQVDAERKRLYDLAVIRHNQLVAAGFKNPNDPIQ
ncbi:MAG: hypothetical protein ABWY04_07205, partial [Arthrobacter sp.]